MAQGRSPSPEAHRRFFLELLAFPSTAQIDAEHLARENKRLGRLLKEAKLRLGQACVEDIEYSAGRELDKAIVRQLATCRWVHEHQNIIVTGMTGVGKTYVACALAQQACRKGYSAIYRHPHRLVLKGPTRRGPETKEKKDTDQ